MIFFFYLRKKNKNIDYKFIFVKWDINYNFSGFFLFMLLVYRLVEYNLLSLC